MFHFIISLFMALSAFQIHHINSYQEVFQSDDFETILQLLRAKNFSRKDIAVTPRELNHWNLKNLLYENYENSKWKKFSIVDILWIQVIVQLRKYELPLEVIQKIKENLKLDFDIMHLIEEQPEEIFEAVQAALLPENSDVLTMDLIRETFEEITDQFRPKDFFEFIVLESYFVKIPNRILINHEGMVVVHNDLYYQELLLHEYYKFHFEKSHISLSINALIASVFKDYKNADLVWNWKLISPEEEKILQAIQTNKRVKSIKVRFNQKSEIDLLEIVDEIKITPQDYLKKIMMEGDYMDIKIITQNGQVVLCERTIKQKI